VTQLAITAISALIVGLMLGFLIWRGYTIRPTKVSFPFVDIQLTRFDGLSPVQFFNNLSIAYINPAPQYDPQAEVAAENTPIVLIHAGWTIVCNAFIRRFQAYPNDDRIEAAASQIGGQNVEFLKMYRDIHVAAIRHADAISRTFASNYLLRAPSLAHRITNEPQENGDQFLRGLLADAYRTIGRPE
jgi:hypothetical protein